MASLILHKRDGTRIVLDHLTNDEMTAAQVPHGFDGIYMLKLERLKRHLTNYTAIACVGDTPRNGKGVLLHGGWAEIWEHIPDEKTNINEQLTAEYSWHSDDAPKIPHWCFPEA